MHDESTHIQEILVVDDDPAVLRILVRLLGKRYRCVTAENGERALELLREHVPDLVVTDVNMFGMSGLELIPRILKIAPDVVIMLISGSQTIDHAIEAIRAGAFDFIRKPFDLDHVEIAVERALKHQALLNAKRHHREELKRLVKERTQQLNYLAYYDPLTGLANRTLFNERLSELILKSGGDTPVAAILVSPNRFNVLRNTVGQGIANQLLKSFAERLIQISFPDATIARFETQEFALLIPHLHSSSEIVDAVKKIAEALTEPFIVDEYRFVINAAIGISVYPNDGADSVSIMEGAGVALTYAKGSGPNSHQFYTAAMHEQALLRLRLENDLRRAIVDFKQFEAKYQPTINIESGRIVGTEALIRWHHPELGLISPLDFIPIAEETGSIVEIGNWVLREACIAGVRWHDSGHKIQVAVNVSAAQFDIGLAESIRSILANTKFDPAFLNLEVTESSIMTNAEFAIETLKQMKDLGIKISIDDFGTGYSSLGQLKSLPIDVLKIDRSFITDATTNPNDASVVTAIIAMAQGLDLEVVAEGVETEEQLNLLKLLRCDEWQGYLCSKPVSFDEFSTLLGTWKVSSETVSGENERLNQ